MNLEKIRRLAENYSGGVRKLASDIDMSEANLHRCISNNKIQAGDLEKIASLLGVSILSFFDEGPAQNNAIATGRNSIAAVNSEVNGNKALEEKVQLLEQLLKEKERTIQILMGPVK